MTISKNSARTLALILAASIAATLPSAWADDSAPLYADGPYAAVMGRYIEFDGDNALDRGVGGTVAAGLRRGPIAFEVNGNYSRSLSHSAKLYGGTLNGLIFPFQRLPGLFGTIGAGVTNVDGYPGIGSTTFNVTTFDGGLGYLFPLQINRYQFGLRAQAVYEYGKRQGRAQDQRPPGIDTDAPSNFHDIVANVGLQFPFGLIALPVTAPEPPVAVVPVADSDGDGVPDGTDQCPGTPAGTVVDAKGCPLPPPCRAPAPGEHISLAGCASGDTIVLRGVNFETAQSKLTVNAKTILDEVAEQLQEYPAIQVEVGGFTDSKGSDAYNQKLSQRRAESTKAYLVERGIAADRATAAGYGERNPIADNETDEGREYNRRVELKITQGNASTTTAPAAETVPTSSAAEPAEPSEPATPPTSAGDAAAPAQAPQ